MERCFINITAGDIKGLSSLFYGFCSLLATPGDFRYSFGFSYLFYKHDPAVHGSFSGMVPSEKGKDIGGCMECGDLSAGFGAYMGSCLSWICRISDRPLETYLRGENKTVSMLAGSRWLGKGMEPDLAKSIEYNSDYILSYLSSYDGILAAFLMAALVLGLILTAIKTAGKGKNRLGRMIGFASGLSLLLPAGINILVNLGLFPGVILFCRFCPKEIPTCWYPMSCWG